MLKGFKEFIMRGNIVDLAVAVAIGAAFTGLVTKFTESVITPLLSRIGAGTDTSLGLLKINIGGGQVIDLNVMLSGIINFVMVAAVLYFLVVLPYNKIRERITTPAEEIEEAEEKQVRLLTEIRDAVGGKNTSPTKK